MGNDRLRPSIFELLQPGQEANVPLMLDLLYGEFIRKLEVLETQMKGRLSKHETDITGAIERLKRVENCPCAVHRDPAHTCVVLDIRDVLASIKLEMTQEVGKIKNRLAWWAGGFSFLITLLHLVAYFWPLFKG